MKTPSEPTDKKNLFIYLLLLTVFFTLIEMSFFIQANQTYLGDFSYISQQLTLPLSMLPEIILFMGAQLLLHLAYSTLIWLCAILLADFFHLSTKYRMAFGISLWCVGILTILIANQYFFPHSKFAELTLLIFSHPQVTQYFFISLLMLCSVLFSCIILQSVLVLYQSRCAKLFFGLSILFCTAYLSFAAPQPKDAATAWQPNIIIIGLDSVRPDFLSDAGQNTHTPFLDRLFNSATVFPDALTPLARTFPAWSSLLTGQYPKQTGFRFDLADQARMDFSHTLPKLLQMQGYETIYATDETRFSNIDQAFGFHRIIGPPMGLNDFLLGTFNDFPLSNLIVNTFLGHWLFPYSYANRAAYFTYQPESFLNLLQPILTKPRTKPLFLAIHFCLPHYPFLWANASSQLTRGQQRYAESVSRLDQQVAQFYQLLQQGRLLQHAIVVFISDHGEGLELPGDRVTEKDLFIASHASNTPPHFYPPILADEPLNEAAGHGGDVLALSQYHILLAFKLYGLGAQYLGPATAGIVSLLDIQPTLLALLHVPNPANAGQNLAPWLRKKLPALPARDIFLESDYTPQALRTIYPHIHTVFLDGIKLFQTHPQSARLTMRETMAKMIIRSKQYADVYDHWLLALYPQAQQTYTPILIDLLSGEWTDDLSSSFAQQSPAPHMLEALQHFLSK